MNLNEYRKFDAGIHKLYTWKAEIEKSFAQLSGIMEGIISDGVVNDKEVAFVREWIFEYRDYRNYAPFKSIIKTIENALSDNVLTIEEAKDIQFVAHQLINQSGYYDLITSSIQTLHGIMSGISSDRIIKDSEIRHIDQWIEEHQFLKGSWPYDELESVLTSILSDQIISGAEKKMFISFCDSVAGKPGYRATDELVDMLKMGYCQVEPHITIPEHTFCLTGISSRYPRTQIGEKIELYGGYLNNNVSKAVNYLVICDEKNSCWAFNCYGRKVEKAVTFRRKGVPIEIINEYDLYDALESLR